jgi:uncharacterized protein (TIGR03000 family)
LPWYGGYGYGYSPWYGYGNRWFYPRSYGYSRWYSPYYSGYYGDNYYYGGNYSYGPDYYGGDQGYYTQQPYMSGQMYGTEGQGQFQEDTNVAHITVRVPANADLEFEGQKTQQKGSMREFVSPPLTPGKDYTYDIKARWTENGRDMTKDQHVTVRAGSQAMVNFLGDRERRQPTAIEGRERQYGAEREGTSERRDQTGTPENRNLEKQTTPSERRTNPSDQRSKDRSNAPGTDRPNNPEPEKP